MAALSDELGPRSTGLTATLRIGIMAGSPGGRWRTQCRVRRVGDGERGACPTRRRPAARTDRKPGVRRRLPGVHQALQRLNYGGAALEPCDIGRLHSGGHHSDQLPARRPGRPGAGRAVRCAGRCSSATSIRPNASPSSAPASRWTSATVCPFVRESLPGAFALPAGTGEATARVGPLGTLPRRLRAAVPDERIWIHGQFTKARRLRRTWRE